MGSERAWAVLSSTAAVAIGAFAAGPLTGAAATLVWGIVAGWTMGPSRLATAALVCVIGLAVSLSFPGALDDPLSALSVQAAGQTWLFGVRMLLVAVAFWVLADEPEPRRTWILALVGAGLLLSLAVRATVALYVPLVLALIGRRPFPSLPFLAIAPRGLLVALALVTPGVAALARLPDRKASPTTPDPAAETNRALARGNLFHAQLWAMRWAGSERRRPGPGHEALLEIELRLGHDGRARQVRDDLARARTPGGPAPSAEVPHP